METQTLTEPAQQAALDGNPKNEGTFISPDFEQRFSEAFQKDQGKTVPAPKIEPAAAKPTPAKKEEPAKVESAKPNAAGDKVTVPGFESPKKEIEEEIPAVIKSGKAAEEWKKMKQAHKTELQSFVERIKQLEADVSKAKPATPAPELESIRKENEQLSEIVRALNVEAHPKFKAYFENRINGVLDMAKSVGGEQGEKIAKILQIRDPDIRNERLESLMEDMPKAAQAQIGALAVELEQIHMEKAFEINKAKENYARINQENQSKAEASKSKALEVFNENIKLVTDSKSGLAVFQPREGDDAWNAGVEQRKKMAQEIFAGDMEVEDLARAAIWASAAPAFLQNLVNYAQENEKLKAQIADLQSGSPTTEESGGEHAPADTGKHSSYEEGLLERAKAINFQ